MFPQMTLMTISEDVEYNSEIEYKTHYSGYNYNLGLSCSCDDEYESTDDYDQPELELAMEEYFATYGSRSNYWRS